MPYFASPTATTGFIQEGLSFVSNRSRNDLAVLFTKEKHGPGCEINCSTWNSLLSPRLAQGLIGRIKKGCYVVTAALGPEKIEELLCHYLQGGVKVPPRCYDALAQYLDLLVKWNTKTNLTSIRDPEEMVKRHFGESLFAAQHLGACETLLDFGSGAGFPGLPMQLLRPEIKITLAESQNRKAAFLREVVRTLKIDTEVWSGRVEAMPPDRRFDVVVMRAVDDMESARSAAAIHTRSRLMVLSTERRGWKLPDGFEVEGVVAMVESTQQQIIMLRRQ